MKVDSTVFVMLRNKKIAEIGIYPFFIIIKKR